MVETVDKSQGVGQAARAMGSGGAMYPRLSLPDSGDRAHFWSLSTGYDPLFGGGQFHEFKEEERFQSFACVASLGGDRCDYCRQGLTEKKAKFGLWVYVDYILHAADNPDEEGDRWELTEWEDRHLFREPIEEALVMQLNSGRKQSRYHMFTAQLAQHGTLQAKKYQLVRQGQMLDTTYELTVVADKAIPKKILAEFGKQDPIVDLFKSTAASAPRPESLPTGAEEEVGMADIGQEPSTAPAADGDDSGLGEAEEAPAPPSAPAAPKAPKAKKLVP